MGSEPIDYAPRMKLTLGNIFKKGPLIRHVSSNGYNEKKSQELQNSLIDEGKLLEYFSDKFVKSKLKRIEYQFLDLPRMRERFKDEMEGHNISFRLSYSRQDSPVEFLTRIEKNGGYFSVMNLNNWFPGLSTEFTPGFLDVSSKDKSLRKVLVLCFLVLDELINILDDSVYPFLIIACYVE